MAASNRDSNEVIAKGNPGPLSSQAQEMILHELHVHQIELELQNEELRRTQAELEASRTRYFNLYDLAPVGYCTLTAQGIILEANLTAATLLGVARGEMVDQPVSRFIVKSHQDTYYKSRKKLLDSTEQQACELQMLRKSCEPVWVNLALSTGLDVDKQPLHRIVLSDISDRKRADLELASTARELGYMKSAIDLHAIVASCDASGNVTHVNQKFCDISRYPRDELISQFHRTVRSECHPASLIQDIWQTIRSGKVWKGEIRSRAKDGGFFWLDCTLVARLGDTGQPVQYILIGADTTERHHLEEALLNKNANLVQAILVAEKANTAKSEFLSNMTHELRSPLNAILGYTQLIEVSLPPPTPKQQAGIKQILQAGWYLLDLIDEILDLALIESGKLTVRLEPVSLISVLRDCHDIVETAAQKKNIRLIFPVFDCPCFVSADLTRLKQVLINLLSNAIKYNHAGGQVDVSCERMPKQRLRITVQDTGDGLPDDQVKQLFQSFNRLGQQDKGEQGTGIGLVVSKRLVELMAGAIGVRSTLNVGSAFWIEMQLASEGNTSA
jgi:PAS domain S-box-containing protein